MSQSYVMLKPESALYIDTIIEELKNDCFSICDYSQITNYKVFAKEIYFIANYIKDPKYYEIIIACMEAETILFGNKSLLLKVENNQDLIDHLVALDRLKSRIRKMISLSKNKTLQAFIDIDKLGVDCFASTYGEIQILSSDNKLQEIYKSNTEIGNFVCLYFSYLHTIDPDLDIYSRTTNFIETSPYKSQLLKNEFNIIKKYKTYHI